MCEPVTLGLASAGLVGSFALAKALTPKAPMAAQQAPAAAAPAPSPVTPPPVSVAKQTPTQASRAPDVQALRKANTGTRVGYNASSASTLLTGPAGVDQSQLSLGRNTLLGS